MGISSASFAASTESPAVECLADLLDREWERLLAGGVVSAPLDEVEDPAERFERFELVGEDPLAGRRRYAMRLRDGSRIRAEVDDRRGRVDLVRDVYDPAAGPLSAVRHALHESRAARAVAQVVLALRQR